MRIKVVRPRHRPLDLPTDRDLIFELDKLDKLLVYIYIIDYNISHVFIRNNIDKEIKLPKNIRIG